MCCFTVLGRVYKLREGGIASHWHQKGKLVRKGGCEFVLEGRMHPRSSDSIEELMPQRPGRDPKLVLSVIMSFVFSCWTACPKWPVSELMGKDRKEPGLVP